MNYFDFENCQIYQKKFFLEAFFEVSKINFKSSKNIVQHNLSISKIIKLEITKITHSNLLKKINLFMEVKLVNKYRNLL